jgi:hypothetical protein
MDWVLIESWKERGVPLHVAIRGIEHAFDSYEAKKRKRSVKTLLYCQEEIGAQFAEWSESRVGGHEDPGAIAKQTNDETSPFSRPTILSHLSRSREALTQLASTREPMNQDQLAEALLRASTLLTEIEGDYATAALPDARRLEDSLTGIERLLDDAIQAVASEGELAAARAEIDAQLKPYKHQMDKTALQLTSANLLRKRLREHFGVPRLSLFFL